MGTGNFEREEVYKPSQLYHSHLYHSHLADPRVIPAETPTGQSASVATIKVARYQQANTES